MPIVTRDATPADDPALSRLLLELGHEVPATAMAARRERFTRGGAGRILVAERDGQVCAFAAVAFTHPIQRDRPVAYLSAFAVAPDARRAGVGATLLHAVEQAGRDAGCGHAVVTSAEHRAGAHAFYPARGWPLTGRRFGRSLD